jgi:glutamate dehydrogenase/leucine dehydrogenase
VRTLLVPAMEFAGVPRAGARIVIQGAGVRGGALARLLQQDGHTIVGLSDVHGAYFDENGLDVAALLDWRAENGSLRGAEGPFQRISNEEMLTSPCDVVIPCAAAGTIHLRVALALQAKLVMEGAHGAVSSRADRVLAERGVSVVPDILGTGGGAIVNYFEWVQNRVGYKWSPETVQERLVHSIVSAWGEVEAIARERSCRLRMAANMLAVRRVAQADRLRGLYA